MTDQRGEILEVFPPDWPEEDNIADPQTEGNSPPKQKPFKEMGGEVLARPRARLCLG